MKEKNKPGENFINEFTKEMINATKEKIEVEKNKPKIIEKIKINPAPVIQQPQVKPTPQPVQIQKPILIKPQPQIQAKPAPILPKPQQKPITQEIPQKTIPIPEKPKLQPEKIDFERILFLIRDQLVTSIECPGANKNLIIKKAGNIIRTQIIMSKEEIIEVIKTFSEKANLPLIEGMLIARVENLEISAVVPTSSAASPSFIIKKEPIVFQNKPLTQLMKPVMQITPSQPIKPMPFIPPKNPNPQAQKPIPINPNPTKQNLPNQ